MADSDDNISQESRDFGSAGGGSFDEDASSEEPDEFSAVSGNPASNSDRESGGGAVGSRRPRAPSEDEEEERRPRRRQRADRAQRGTVAEDEDMADGDLELENIAGDPVELLKQEAVQKGLVYQFKQFIDTFRDEREHLIYQARLIDVCTRNQHSLLVEYGHIAGAIPTTALWLADYPKDILPLLNRAAKEVAEQAYPDLFEEPILDIHVRVINLPLTDMLRELRKHHLSHFIQVEGVVTRRTGVFPQLQEVKYDCLKCGFTLGPYYQNTAMEVKPNVCSMCSSKGPFEENVTQTIYKNYQKLTLQESPGTVPAGRMPRHKEVILLDDLIDNARPGEQIVVTGVYANSYDASLNIKNSFPVFNTVIEANSITKREDQYSTFRLTEEDLVAIDELKRHPRLGERIVKSIAPSIHGHENIKLGIALALFGGQEKRPSASHRLRGDINMLLLGDPGTAKSQFLKYVEKVAQRAVYTTGKGASAVGLTAAVQKDPVTKEWTLEGGALVLADRGVCLIDEFDKMNDQDRVSIHEAMEQQSISISKAGIVTSLQARCSVIAAANPNNGRYDSSRTLAENVELSDPILSRFDILCVIKDVVDPRKDTPLARFVINSHMRAHPLAEEVEILSLNPTDPDYISQELLRKYITSAKQSCHPKLQPSNRDKIEKAYTELRKASSIGHGLPVAVRHMESIIRMAEAHALMHFRNTVVDEDVDVAIRVMLESFVSTQKEAQKKTLQHKFRAYLTRRTNNATLLLESLFRLERDERRMRQAEGLPLDKDILIPCSKVAEKAREVDINNLQPFYNSAAFAQAGFALDSTATNVICSTTDN